MISCLSASSFFSICLSHCLVSGNCTIPCAYLLLRSSAAWQRGMLSSPAPCFLCP
uniref:Uncharacterized protein n=1 Tax=Arundo donax TaxID=35708 RepID=A0A0A9C3Q8_ARUDO